MIEEKTKNKFNNLKQRLINFFKNPKEVISFFLPIVITICLLLPVPYYIKLGGGTIKIDDNIEIANSYNNKGSLEALYVKEAKGIVLTFLLSYVVPSFEKEKITEVTLENETVEDYNYRERLYFTSSLDAATKVAFEQAGKKVTIKENKFIVLYIDKISNTTLEVGDEILKVAGKEVSSYDDIEKEVSSKKIGDSVAITVLREGKKIETTSILQEVDNTAKMGVVLSNEISYESDPKVIFDFDGNQAGPSGGLMIALAIYNKLVEEDITQGHKVVGTGTLDIAGNVGEIGGIKHKLMAADKEKADIVLVPYNNYQEAKEIKDKEGYNFTLFSVKTFAEALEKLASVK